MGFNVAVMFNIINIRRPDPMPKYLQCCLTAMASRRHKTWHRNHSYYTDTAPKALSLFPYAECHPRQCSYWAMLNYVESTLYGADIYCPITGCHWRLIPREDYINLALKYWYTYMETMEQFCRNRLLRWKVCMSQRSGQSSPGNRTCVGAARSNAARDRQTWIRSRSRPHNPGCTGPCPWGYLGKIG